MKTSTINKKESGFRLIAVSETHETKIEKQTHTQNKYKTIMRNRFLKSK